MKNKPITSAVLTALKRWYVEENLSQEQIAQIAGVNRSSVNAWLAGEARSIRAVNWARMLPYLRQYLPAEEAAGLRTVEIGERIRREMEEALKD